MTSRNGNYFPLFQPVTSKFKAEITNESFCLQTTSFATSLDSHQKIVLMLTNRYLVVSESQQWKNEPRFWVELNFELKFEIIYADEDRLPAEEAVLSPKVGLRFFKNQQICQFYLKSESLINIWVNNLSKHLTQYGFHNLYKGIKRLGKGGSASVYEVLRVTDQQRFAVKAFPKVKTVLSENATNRIKLLNQIETLRKFDNPNIIKLEAVFETDNSIYLVLELLQAGQLQTRINSREGNFSLQEIKELIIGLARGLEEMHSQRVMHRDLKPENIMLRNDGTMQPVIADFGLSTDVDSEDYIHYRCGTPGYVAPEIIPLKKGMKIQPECDIFSAGVILHILLTKRVLFEGSSYEEVYKQNHNLRFSLTGSLYKHINPEAMDLLRRMLTINPADRITASEMLSHPFLQDELAIEVQKHVVSPPTTARSNHATRTCRCRNNCTCD